MDTQNATTEQILEAYKANDDDTIEWLGTFQLMGNDLLVAAASGRLDLNQIAIQTLAQRGFAPSGKWVGFKEAQIYADTRLAWLAQGNH